MIIRRCEHCELHKAPCPSPPPDPKRPWGHAEYVQLGDYWMHMSALDRDRLSYGSALAAYQTAAERATSPGEAAIAAGGYLAAWRGCSAQSKEDRDHAYAAPVEDCHCPICVDARDHLFTVQRPQVT